MQTNSILITFAASDNDGELASEAASDVRAVLEARGERVATSPLETLTTAEIDRASLVFTLDTTPAPAWISRSDGAAGLKSFLQERGVRFTGSGPGAMSLAKNKLQAKSALSAAGIATPVSVSPERIGALPVVGKPIRGSASVGVTYLSSLEEVESYLRRSTGSGEHLMEEYISGREITVAVLEVEGRARSLAPVEITLDEPIFTAARKANRPYPAFRTLDPTDEGFLPSCQAAARAFEACGCSGYARIDIRYNRDRGAVVLEVNCSPRLSRNEYVAIAARRSGIEYASLISAIVDAANGPA